MLVYTLVVNLVVLLVVLSAWNVERNHRVALQAEIKKVQELALSAGGGELLRQVQVNRFLTQALQEQGFEVHFRDTTIDGNSKLS